MMPVEDPRAPKYWRYESSGRLEGPITRLINNKSLSADDILLIRAYLRQWIDSPAWDMNPNMDEDSKLELAKMRSLVRNLKNRLEIVAWLRIAVDWGMDPL